MPHLEQVGEVDPLGLPAHQGLHLGGRRDVGAVAASYLQHADVGEGLDGLTHGVAADAERRGEDRLGRDAVADAPLAGGEQRAHAVDRLVDQGGGGSRG
ncbi:hypothetical protein ASE19_09580 [Nocardioides sp. Root79]|nr:hypothetical protein ASE19_09580 [Nocardioides sp. Root79]KRC72206.1 hypothetical protein ASE20_06115 [Nocardioides sp. Root240]